MMESGPPFGMLGFFFWPRSKSMEPEGRRVIFAAKPSECRFFCGNVTESQPEPGTRQMDETEAFPDPLIPDGKARIRQIPSAVPFCRADTGRIWRDFLKKKPLPLKGRFFGCSDSMAAKNLFGGTAARARSAVIRFCFGQRRQCRLLMKLFGRHRRSC